jgi:hypothetical protein
MGKGRDKKKEERKDTKELGWREGVMKEPMLGALDCKWSSLEEWAAHFDKKKMEEGKEKSKLVAAAEEKARIKLLQKIHSSVTTKLMTTLLEVSSLVVNGTEVAMRATADDVGAMLAAMNGIILGHHFGFNKNKMFPYLRRCNPALMSAQNVFWACWPTLDFVCLPSLHGAKIYILNLV